MIENKRKEVDVVCGRDSEQIPDISVVLPTLNEEKSISICIEKIKSAASEINSSVEIIVSDSSEDATPEIAEECGAIVVEPDREGYGYAYRYAFQFVRGQYVVIGDADSTYDFSELPKLFYRMSETDADIVIGSRLNGDIKSGAMPLLHQYIGNPALTKFLNVFYDAGVSDAHSGFRIIRKDILAELDLSSDGMEFASEMIMDASSRGFKIVEVPITYHPRKGESTLNTFRDGWLHLKFMLLNAPGYLFTGPGAIMSLFGLVLMGLAFSEVSIAAATSQPILFGVRSMIVGSLITIVGVQILSLGIFASITSDPIRRPDDPLTIFITGRLELELGILAGSALLTGGSALAASIIFTWMRRGYDALPSLQYDILAFTIIVLGIQVIYSSFFITSIREK